MGSSVSRPTGRTSFSVISAKASAALLCKSTLSEKDNVFNASRGCPAKKFVAARSIAKKEGCNWRMRDAEPMSTEMRFEVQMSTLTLEKLEEIRYCLTLTLQ